MIINEYIKKIQQEIEKGKPYKEYVCLFKEYKDYLESMVRQNPRDITAVCQLAAVLMELRYETEASIEIMEKALSQFENELTDDEQVRLHTNLAFFYKENGDENKELISLKKAVDLKPSTPNAYDALAVCLTAKAESINTSSDFTSVLPLFEQAKNLSKSFRYQYNYAVALYSAGNIMSAKTIFEELYHHNSSNAKVLYGLGVCYCYLADIKAALDKARLLAGFNADDEVDEFQIAQLFYLCGDYERHNAVFDNCKMTYYYDVSWLAPYFYCLKVLGNDSGLIKKYNEVVNSKNADIEEAKNEKLDDNYTANHRNENVTALQKELEDIETAYHKIMYENYKPQVTPKLYFIYECYLIDCPRHQHIL